MFGVRLLSVEEGAAKLVGDDIDAVLGEGEEGSIVLEGDSRVSEGRWLRLDAVDRISMISELVLLFFEPFAMVRSVCVGVVREPDTG